MPNLRTKKNVKLTASSAKPKSAASAKKKPAAAAKKGAAVPAVGTETAHGAQAAFLRFLPQAQALPADQVTPLRFDPELAYYNLRCGVQALLPHRETLQLDLPRMDLQRLFDLPELGQAVLFATSQAAGDPGTQAAPRLKDLLGEGRKLRGKMLTAADALVAFGLIPAPTVAKIRKGRGSLDSARDLGDLAALYTKYGEAFRDNTPVTTAHATRAAELGSQLLARLSPGAAKRGSRSVAQTESVMARDRLASLLVRGHRDLRRVGYWVWGDAFDEHVPALQARARTSKKATPTAPQPSAPAR